VKGGNKMCIVCIEYSKGKMTPAEGLRALGEVKATEDKEHIEKVKMKLWLDEWHENMPQTD
jgi:hypothetical protein